jgi:hypothetical protein
MNHASALEWTVFDLVVVALWAAGVLWLTWRWRTVGRPRRRWTQLCISSTAAGAANWLSRVAKNTSAAE